MGGKRWSLPDRGPWSQAEHTRAGGVLFHVCDPCQLPPTWPHKPSRPTPALQVCTPSKYRDRVPLSSPPKRMRVEAVTIAKAQCEG